MLIDLLMPFILLAVGIMKKVNRKIKILLNPYQFKV